VITRAQSTRQGNKPMLRGELEQVSLPSVLSFLELERKTGILHVEGPRPIRVLLRAGAPIRLEQEAAPPAANDKDALFEILDWRQGQFEFVPQEVTGEDHLATNVTSLLLEHARVLDESKRHGPR
jgi:hypothetical protein